MNTYDREQQIRRDVERVEKYTESLRTSFTTLVGTYSENVVDYIDALASLSADVAVLSESTAILSESIRNAVLKVIGDAD